MQGTFAGLEPCGGKQNLVFQAGFGDGFQELPKGKVALANQIATNLQQPGVNGSTVAVVLVDEGFLSVTKTTFVQLVLLLQWLTRQDHACSSVLAWHVHPVVMLWFENTRVCFCKELMVLLLQCGKVLQRLATNRIGQSMLHRTDKGDNVTKPCEGCNLLGRYQFFQERS